MRGHIRDTFRHERPDYYIHNYPEILDLKVNAISGQYDLVGVTNWRSMRATRILDLSSKLHLDPKRQYVAFDFWNQALAGIFEKEMKLEVGPHDTRVLAIHPLQGRPQLIVSPKSTARFIEPMECLPVPTLPEGKQWTWEKSSMAGGWKP